MEKLALDAVDHTPHPRGVTNVRKLLGDAIGAQKLDVTYYEVPPGDQFAGAYHRHLEREEVFVVLSGTATFRTGRGAVEVAAMEAISFAPGDWQLGRNDGPERVTALLIGAPPELAPVEALLRCSRCEARTRVLVEPEQGDGETTESRKTCQQCGSRIS